MTELILETFRLNGRLLSIGDKLVKPLGLTSARWQVLGAIHFAQTPQTVAWLARSMGLTRQGVQRTANVLEEEGLVAFKPNPHHKRAQLVMLTEKGRKRYEAADQHQTDWINTLTSDFELEDVQCALKILEDMRTKLEEDLNPE